jgi:tRNA A-37 threonylcarbamoyl transferase component Bud32
MHSEEQPSILLTEAVPGGATLATTGLNHPAAPRELGLFLARMHLAGLVHGSLFARNLLLTPDGGFRLVDLDQAQVHSCGRLPPLGTRMRDLTFLGESIKGSRTDRLRTLAAYAKSVGEKTRTIGADALAWREEARERLDRRRRERPPGRRVGGSQ